MPFVLDSSVALAWVLPDEGNQAADALADRMERDAAHVPGIWPLEVGNVLLAAVRRGRIREGELGRLAAALSALPVELDHDPERAALRDVLDLARRLGLTTYDAAYIELAKRRALPLATLDATLRQACATSGVRVLP
jgi:predicted nucleic acid-binding protein